MVWPFVEKRGRRGLIVLRVAREDDWMHERRAARYLASIQAQLRLEESATGRMAKTGNESEMIVLK